MDWKIMRRWFAVTALASAFGLLMGHKPAQAQEDGQQSGRLAGVWNVTLLFPDCSSCPCPGGKANIPIPALHEYSNDQSLLEIPGFTLFRGPGLGRWTHSGDRQFDAHFKFFLFNSDGTGTRRASEEVTSHITLTGPDSFEAAETFDLLGLDGKPIAKGCPINATAERLTVPNSRDAD